MNIEIVEFYPQFKDAECMTGKIRILIVDIGLEMLGIQIRKDAKGWYVQLPFRKGIEHKTKEMVRYPLVSFVDKTQQQDLVTSIRQKIPEFMEKRLADTERPIVFEEYKPAKTKPFREKKPTKQTLNTPQPKGIGVYSTKRAR